VSLLNVAHPGGGISGQGTDYLSRVYLALAEEMWLNANDSRDTEPQIRIYVHKASRHWEIAKDLDTTGRLTDNLPRHLRRIDTMRAKLREKLEPKGKVE
jgi:hypothetical protein